MGRGSAAKRTRRELPRPPGEAPPATPAAYQIVADDKSIEKQWRDLSASHRGSLRRFYDYLRRTPTTREGERVYPMANPALAGLWGCEVGGGARMYYRVDEEDRVVIIREISTSHR